MDSVTKDVLISITAFYHIHLDEFHMEPHRHASYEIMYVAHGACHVTVKNQVFKLTEHTGIFIHPNTQHTLIVEPEPSCAIANLEFRIDDTRSRHSISITRILSAYPAARTLFFGGHSCQMFFGSADYYNCLRDVIKEMTTPMAIDSYMVDILMKRMLVVLCSKSLFRQHKTGIRHVEQAKDFINEHYVEDIAIEAIASHVGVNKAYLQRLFRQHERITIVAFINMKRLERAAFLLTNTNQPVCEVGIASGFNSRQHFGHVFRTHFGVSPQGYRKQSGSLLTKAKTETFPALNHIL